MFAAWPILHSGVPPEELPSELRGGSRAGMQSLSRTIMELNDIAGWTRTEISDWIEKFENRHEAYVSDRGISLVHSSSSLDEPNEDMMVMYRR